MDTPIIAQYYRETEPEKRKELLEQAIASGEDQEANKIRKEIWEARYKGTTNERGHCRRLSEILDGIGI